MSEKMELLKYYIEKSGDNEIDFIALLAPLYDDDVEILKAREFDKLSDAKVLYLLDFISCERPELYKKASENLQVKEYFKEDNFNSLRI